MDKIAGPGNAYVAEAAIEDRRRRGLFGDLPLEDCLDNYRAAVDQAVETGLASHGQRVLILAGLHAAAALFHHHVLKDGVLRRMWPRLGRTA